MKPSRAALLAFLAVVTVAVPFMVWQETWFGRTLSDAQITKYLLENGRPRRIQHALSQIAERIQRGDAAAAQWYPQVAALRRHAEPKIRTTAAWTMGQDNRSEEFHRALIEMLGDPDVMVRRNAALALVRFHDASGRPELIGILRPQIVRAPAAGQVESIGGEGDVRAGALLATVRDSQGKLHEVKSPAWGRVVHLDAEEGSRVDAGAGLVTLEAGPDQVWEALRALYLIGEPGDLADVDRYTGASNRIGRQAMLTAQAIRARTR